jgi:hypothetical protein
MSLLIVAYSGEEEERRGMSKIKFPHDYQRIKSSPFLPNYSLIRNKRMMPKAPERW